MNAASYMRALAELWGQGGQAFAAAQQSLFAVTAERMAKASSEGTAAGFPGLGAGPGASEFAVASDAFAKLWSSATEISTTITQGMEKAEAPDPIVAHMLGRIFDPRLWFSSTDDMDEALQSLSEGPRLADLWDVERKFAGVFNAWVAVRRRSLEHNTVMLDAWVQAAGAFAKRLNDLSEAGQTIESPREVLTSWIETANEIMLETQRSEAFLTTQRESLKASTDLRLAQQEVAEYYSEMFGYPSRAEVDDVHKTVTELRRELRALKREMRERRTPTIRRGRL